MLSITAPEEIAKKYGGNKRKIQQAAAQGLIDPTSAVLAGMFVDRMRNAAAKEQAEQPTVAEQVMAPQPQPQMPPQGMAATPQAQQMPQQAQMGAPQAPQMQQPQGMAMGGGLDSIPYNEGDYAEGGIVSFAAGDPVRMDVTDDQLRNMSRAQLRAVASNGQIPPHIRNAASARLQSITPAQGQQPTVGGLAAADLPRVPNVSGAMDRVGQAIMGTGDVDRNIEVSDAGIPEGQFRGVFSGKTPAEKLMGDGSSLDVGMENFTAGTPIKRDGLLGAVDDGMSMFNQLKNAPERVDPAEQARRDRVALAMQTRGEGQNVFPVDNSDPFAIGMETFTDGQRATTPTEQTAPMRSQQIPTSLGPQVGRGQDPRLFGEGAERRAAIAALAARDPNLVDPADGMKPEIRPMTRDEVRAAGLTAIDPTRTRGQERSDFDRFLSNEGFAIKDPNAQTVADQVQQTEQAVTQPAPKVEPEKESKPADTTMDITEQFKVFDKELAGLMEKPEHGKYRKEMDNLLGNREERLKDAKKEGFSMALLQAGLGMLAQGGGQTALQALGKAALPATKQYAEAIKDAKKEDRELLKLGLSMEQMDAKELAATKRALAQIYGSRANTMISRATSLDVARIGAESREKVAETTSAASKGMENALRAQTAMTSLLGQEGSVRGEQAEIRRDVDFSRVGQDFAAASEAYSADPNDPDVRQRYIDTQRIYNAEIKKLEDAQGITSRLAQINSRMNQLSQLGGGSTGGGNVVDFSSLAQ